MRNNDGNYIICCALIIFLKFLFYKNYILFILSWEIYIFYLFHEIITEMLIIYYSIKFY